MLFGSRFGGLPLKIWLHTADGWICLGTRMGIESDLGISSAEIDEYLGKPGNLSNLIS